MAFFVVYIREAHPIDGDAPLRRGVAVRDPKSLEERLEVAKTCAKALRFSMPMLIDELDDGAARAYGGYPDRLYLIGVDGRVVYRGGPGPRGFKPDELARELEKIVRPGRIRV